MAKLKPEIDWKAWGAVVLGFALFIYFGWGLFATAALGHEPEHDGYLFPAAVEQWRGLVVDHFEPGDVHMALHIIQCESNGNQFAHNNSSHTAGLFQHRPRYWHDRAQLAGLHPANAYDAHDNVHVGAWLIYVNGGIRHWERCGPWAVAHA